MERARFWGSEGSFEPSCEVGDDPGCFYAKNRLSGVEIAGFYTIVSMLLKLSPSQNPDS